MPFKKGNQINKGRIFSKEHRENLRIANIGKITSEEVKLKISKSKKGVALVGKGFKDKNHSKEAKEKISNFQKGRKHDYCAKENSNFWKGGISEEIYPKDWTYWLKESIRSRDNNICQECGIHENELTNRNKKLDIHHIDYNKENLNECNLISLCRTCHIKTNFNREYWIKYFKQNTDGRLNKTTFK